MAMTPVRVVTGARVARMVQGSMAVDPAAGRLKVRRCLTVKHQHECKSTITCHAAGMWERSFAMNEYTGLLDIQ